MTAQIIDDGPTHLLAELGERERAATSRSVVLIAEEAGNGVRTIRLREVGAFGLDGVWADDFHHAIHVFLAGEQWGYYADDEVTLAEIAAALTGGFVYQGQPTRRGGPLRGTRVTDEPATAFVFCLQSHDQVGNRAYGERRHHDIDAGRYAVASVLLLLAPPTPLLFMGQEFAAAASWSPTSAPRWGWSRRTRRWAACRGRRRGCSSRPRPVATAERARAPGCSAAARRGGWRCRRGRRRCSAGRAPGRVTEGAALGTSVGEGDPVRRLRGNGGYRRTVSAWGKSRP